MKIQLNAEQTIKGKLCAVGEVVIVRKDEGQRMIDKGIANLLIEVPENRIVGAAENRGPVRFSNHTQFGRGS